MIRRVALALALVGALLPFQTATTTAAAGTVTYRMQQTVPFNPNVCGVQYTGWIHEIQQYTLTPTGQLNFHYIANGQADGVDANGKAVQIHLNNKELDHIIATTPPNLAPYGGSLQGWVAANFDTIVEINAQYNERWTGQAKGRTLDNHWVFQVNHNGTTVDSITFVGGCN